MVSTRGAKLVIYAIGDSVIAERGIHVWVGYPWWAGLGFKRGQILLNVHLQALLGCLGVNWRVRWKWFKESWAVLLYRGWRHLRLS